MTDAQARTTSTRQQDVRTAIRLEGITLAWMVVEALASIGAGLFARSLLLLAFGVDSVIELLSACVLMVRLRREVRDDVDGESIERLEERAGKVAGVLLITLSIYVVLSAVYGLMLRHHAENSGWGIAVALVAAFGMPFLARAKIKAADKIGSRALRADAMETFTCGYLAWVLLAGLIANALLHWWWLDGAASLVIVPFLLREAREAMTGECCDGCHVD